MISMAKPRPRPAPEPISDPGDRDFVMARLAACRVSLQAAVELVDETLGYMVDPSDDAKGKKRDEGLDACEEAIGAAGISLREASRVWSDDEYDSDRDEEEEYPDDDEEEDGDEDEDEEDDEDEEVG